jgi:hypothetical protein
MRHLLPLLLLGTSAVPAMAAQPQPVPVPPPPPPAAVLPPEIADGRMFDQLGTMVGALSRALLNMPVGEIEAAIENRPVTRADRQRTVRSVTGTSEKEIEAEVESSKEAVKAGGQALVRALPVVVEALNKAGEELERATANLPQPGYPRR